jgi:glycosyltransferase involved in cell wall biosynthesis
MNNPLVSIVVPVYNSHPFIELCVQSLLQQSYKNLEIILINDGSTDSTLSLINSKFKSNKIISIYSKENGGPSSAKNVGILKAKGDYVTFVDSDDWLDTDMIEKLVDSIIIKKADFTMCAYRYWIKNKPIETKISADLFDINSLNDLENIIINYSNPTSGIPYGGCGKLYSLKIIKEYNIKFDETVSLTEDVRFTFSYFKYINSGTLVLDAKYNVLIRENSITTKFRENQFEIHYSSYLFIKEILFFKKLCNKLSILYLEINLIKLFIETLILYSTFKGKIRNPNRNNIIRTLIRNHKVKNIIKTYKNSDLFFYIKGISYRYSILVYRYAPPILKFHLLDKGLTLITFFKKTIVFLRNRDKA